MEPDSVKLAEAERPKSAAVAAPHSVIADSPADSSQKMNKATVAVSVVIPLYNEEENIPALYAKLCDSFQRLGKTYELVLIDDGSKDKTGELLRQLADKDEHIVTISFVRNHGQTAAMTAGIDYATGDVIICMDGDLQNDPADIGRVLALLEEGHDCVCGWRKDRQDPIHRVIPSQIANALISRISGVKLHDYGCTLKAFRHNIVKNVRLYGEMHRFIPIYASWQGARITEIPVTHHPRTRGKSNYGLERTFKVILDLIVVQFLASYATKPIYLFGSFGLLSLFISAVASFAAMVFKVLPADNAWHKDLIKTPLPVFAVGLFVVGIQMILIGLLAEIQMRTYYESQNKPIYTIKSVHGRRVPD